MSEETEGKQPPEQFVDPAGLSVESEDEQNGPSGPAAASNTPPADDPEELRKAEREKMEKEFGDEDDDSPAEEAPEEEPEATEEAPEEEATEDAEEDSEEDVSVPLKMTIDL